MAIGSIVVARTAVAAEVRYHFANDIRIVGRSNPFGIAGTYW
jgi:hypothetical protein